MSQPEEISLAKKKKKILTIDSDDNSESGIGELKTKEEKIDLAHQMKETHKKILTQKQNKVSKPSIQNEHNQQKNKPCPISSDLFNPDNSDLDSINEIQQKLNDRQKLNTSKSSLSSSGSRIKLPQKPNTSVVRLQQTTSKTHKEWLITEFLKRWWYYWGEWPDPKSDYQKSLQERRLVVVEQKNIKSQTDDKPGLQKVYQIEGYQGLFKNEKGELINLRDYEKCPSYENVSRFNEHELKQMLETALHKQQQQLIEFRQENYEDVFAQINKDINKLLTQLKK